MPRASQAVSDAKFIAQAVELALDTETRGNLPIAAVITLDGRVVATGANQIRHPAAHPGRHAEVLALANLPDGLVYRLRDMTCYTTLEPCLMCFGSLVLHEVGRVVFGAVDPLGGAVDLVKHLPPYVASKASAMHWVGPVSPETCGPLWERVAAKYGHLHAVRGSSDTSPCGV